MRYLYDTLCPTIQYGKNKASIWDRLRIINGGHFLLWKNALQLRKALYSHLKAEQHFNGNCTGDDI